jgi:CheY-like chemotaxis protein
MRILVADDEPFILSLMEMVLIDAGHTVKTVKNGKEALQCLECETFDVVITDRSMPELDGLGLAKQIKARNPSQTIVLVTGSGEEEAWPPYFDAVLSKPVPADVLQDVLRRFGK